ncbi:aspartyl/asparaginyl beta-hydroxylase domain-containing protein [Dokdonella soli]|uniref:Aspartyl/asparaginy/proline hydroxylase domain-containing protein n=1 Tax=Dokdonella soli TaxID=529810 RepID=A0ABP3TKF6_9GAMM
MNQASPLPHAERRAAALALANQGRMLEAERAFGDLLRELPDDVDALNFLAICAHRRGQIDESLELLGRAHRAQPDDAITLVNLGALQRERGHLDEAHAAMKRGTELAPDLFAARLRLGEILQALGRHADALPVYFGAIMTAQEHGHWLSDATTAVELQPLVKHAMRLVSAGRRELFLGLLQPLRERHGGAALARVEKSLAIYLGELPPNYPEPKQRPKFLYFPDLPAPRFFDRELFPWYAQLEAQTAVIRDEMLALLAEDRDFEPFLGHVDDKQTLHDYLRGDRGAPAWNAFFFYRHGVRHDANALRCPRAAAALDATPLCHVREHAPEVCFSVLTPGSHILPHHGVTNTRVVTHLPLVVPDGDLALNVSGELRRWEEGRCFSFDDTYEHEAWNRSADTRVVVLLDAWNPYLTEVEREAVTELIGAIGDFNRAAGV